MGQPLYERGQTETPILRFSGQIFEPLLSGALHWPVQRTLLVADLHLEKMSAFARTGQMLPPYDTGITLARLEADLRRTGAQRLVSLGDSFHRNEGVSTLSELDRARIDAMTDMAEWVWLSGNHDPAPHALGGQCRSSLDVAGLTLMHEPQRDARGLIAGHLHPAARVAMAGRTSRNPCFVHDNRLMILPAYGASTGSINILSAAFMGLLHWPGLEVTMLGRDRLYPVSPRRLVRG